MSSLKPNLFTNFAESPLSCTSMLFTAIYYLQQVNCDIFFCAFFLNIISVFYSRACSKVVVNIFNLLYFTLLLNNNSEKMNHVWLLFEIYIPGDAVAKNNNREAVLLMMLILSNLVSLFTICFPLKKKKKVDNPSCSCGDNCTCGETCSCGSKGKPKEVES